MRRGFQNISTTIPTNIGNLINHFSNLTTKFNTKISIVGFFIIFVFVLQIISGIMLALSLVPECMLVPVVRDEEDLEDLYTDEFFWLHERGVDVIFIFSYVHLARKLYLLNFYLEQESAWKTGTFLLMLIQVVTFLVLVLCCTHLSDITLKIAANTLHTFFSLKTKIYWILFTDKNLNTDTLIRLTYLHYISAFIVFFLAVTHAMDMHYDWKADNNYNGFENELQWWNEVFLTELIAFMEVCILIFIIAEILYQEPEALSYEFFMWGDIGAITDPKFNQVAPHWYFRPLMSFLLVIPHAIIGVLGLVLFFFLLYFQPLLHKNYELNHYKVSTTNLKVKNTFSMKFDSMKINVDFDLYYQSIYYFFIFACLYTTTFLPNGKYYQLLGGNAGMLFSYFFILMFLSFPGIKSLKIIKANINILRNFVLQISGLTNTNTLRK